MQPKDVLREIERELGFLEGLSWALEDWACEVMMEKATEIRKKIEKMQEEYDGGIERMMQALGVTGDTDCHVANAPRNDGGVSEMWEEMREDGG